MHICKRKNELVNNNISQSSLWWETLSCWFVVQINDIITSALEMAFSFPSWGKWRPESWRIRPTNPGAAHFPLGSPMSRFRQTLYGGCEDSYSRREPSEPTGSISPLSGAGMGVQQGARGGGGGGEGGSTAALHTQAAGEAACKKPSRLQQHYRFSTPDIHRGQLQKKLYLIKIIQYCRSFLLRLSSYVSWSFWKHELWQQAGNVL